MKLSTELKEYHRGFACRALILERNNKILLDALKKISSLSHGELSDSTNIALNVIDALDS